eukprot:411214-Rhodomonas_salina.1
MSTPGQLCVTSNQSLAFAYKPAAARDGADVNGDTREARGEEEAKRVGERLERKGGGAEREGIEAEGCVCVCRARGVGG